MGSKYRGFSGFLFFVFLFALQSCDTARAEVPNSLIQQIIKAESSGNPLAVGSSGERGLFQFTEATWKDATMRAFGKPLPFDKAFDASINYEAGVNHLNWIQKKLGSRYSPALLVACHNAGFYGMQKRHFIIPQSLLNHPNKIYRSILNGKEIA